MKLNITPGDLSNIDEMNEFVDMILSRSNEADGFAIDLQYTNGLNLAQFNKLIVVYVKLRRLGKKIHYKNFGNTVQNLVNKTKFYHVFGS